MAEYKRILRSNIMKKREMKSQAGYPMSDTFDIPHISGPKWQFLDMWYREVSKSEARDLFEKGIDVFGVDRAGEDYLITSIEDIDQYEWFGVSKKIKAAARSLSEELWVETWEVPLEEFIKENAQLAIETLKSSALEYDLSKEKYLELENDMEDGIKKLLQAIKYANIFK